MLRTWIALQCGDCGCQFPRTPHGVTVPCDGAFESPAALRVDAKNVGWQRYGGEDYCSECEESHRHLNIDTPKRKGGSR
jgi:hypothetical protein